MNLLDLLFPVKCPVCGQLLKRKEKGVCQNCRKSLPRVIEPTCSRCGKPIEKDTQEYCRDCSRKRQAAGIESSRTEGDLFRKDPICQGTALWLYTDSMKRAIANFKYNGCYGDGVFYAEEMVRFRRERLEEWQPDYVIPVPLHRRRRWFRGYNQAACVAEELGMRIEVPVASTALERICSTRPQKGLDDRNRRDNVKDAFRVGSGWQEKLRGRRVLLVDDIYTTGATLEACASVLCDAGVKKVYFACLCTGMDY